MRAPVTGRGEVRCSQQPVLRAPRPRGAIHTFCLSFQALPRVRGAAPGYFRPECGDGAGRWWGGQPVRWRGENPAKYWQKKGV